VALQEQYLLAFLHKASGHIQSQEPTTASDQNHNALLSSISPEPEIGSWAGSK
jgi:hypothetical protein